MIAFYGWALLNNKSTKTKFNYVKSQQLTASLELAVALCRTFKKYLLHIPADDFFVAKLSLSAHM
jgi:hypothetical protein